MKRTARGATSKSDPASGTRDHGGWRRVADGLQEDIIFGRLFARQRLVEDDLMSQYGCSRHACRAAIDDLVRLGLVVREANRGASVRSFSSLEVRNLFEVQQVLEAHAIRRMPLPAEPDLVARLKAVQDNHEAAGRSMKPLEIRRANQEFHDLLFRACGNAQLADAIKSYSILTDPIRMLRIPDSTWRRQAAKDHRDIIRALSVGDRDLLAQVVARHLEPTRTYFLATRSDEAGLPS